MTTVTDHMPATAPTGSLTPAVGVHSLNDDGTPPFGWAGAEKIKQRPPGGRERKPTERGTT